MTFPIADTHTHLYFGNFDRDRDQVIEQNRREGVVMQVQIGCDEVLSLAALDLAKEHDDFYCTLGVHPADVKMCFSEDNKYWPAKYKNYQLTCHTFDELFKLFETWTEENPGKVVAFGETGFDLYHENSPEIFEIQTECFKRHIKLAQKHEKPLVIHGRNSEKEMLEFFESELEPGFKGSQNPGPSAPGVIHCFCEGPEYGKIMTEQYGFFLGIGGIATHPQAQKVRDAIREIPIEFLVTETDAPFLTPQRYKKSHKRNEAKFLAEVVELIAQIKGVETEETAEILVENAKKLYQI